MSQKEKNIDTEKCVSVSDVSNSVSGIFDSLVPVALISAPSDIRLLDKKTTQYLVSEKAECIRVIKRILYKMKATRVDAEEIYQESFDTLNDSKDYNLRCTLDGALIPLEGYVYALLEIATKKFLKKENDYASLKARMTNTKGDNEELDPLSYVKSYDTDPIGVMTIAEFCQELEMERYKLGFDIFTVLYVNLKCKQSHIKNTIWDMLSISTENLSKRDCRYVFERFVNTISAHENGLECAVSTIRPYVYGVDMLDKLIQAL